MSSMTGKVYLVLPLLAVVGLYSASAQDNSTQFELETSGLESRHVQFAADDCVYNTYTCSAYESLCTRPTLTGDWFGHRSCLQQSGIMFRGNVTQFAFGIDGGISNPVPPPFGQGNTFKYTGRGEYDFIFDLEKFGGPAKGKFLLGVQHWWGEFGNVSFNTGAFAPAVLAAIAPPTPNDPGRPFITDFLITQPVSERLIAFVGKKNVLGTADQDIFAGGDGTSQFINQALLANPAYLLALPYSSFTAGVVMPREWGVATVYVWDPQDRTRDFFRLKDLFSDGILVGTQIKVNTNFFCLPGEQHVGGIWKHTPLPDLSFSAPAPILFQTSPSGPATKSDAYTIYWGFDQYLMVYTDQPVRGWGLFGRASISDANPTPYRYFLSVGIGGDSPFGGHRGDTFGVGWYYNGVSSKLGPIPQAALGPRHGTGVEMYYNFQVTPWLNITPDIQYIRPGISAFGGDSFIAGVRVNMKL